MRQAFKPARGAMNPGSHFSQSSPPAPALPAGQGSKATVVVVVVGSLVVVVGSLVVVVGALVVVVASRGGRHMKRFHLGSMRQTKPSQQRSSSADLQNLWFDVQDGWIGFAWVAN